LATLLAGDDGAGRLGADLEAAPAAASRAARSATAADSSAPEISYHVRYVTAGSNGWRSRFAGRLEPVARQGGVAVWKADGAAIADLLSDLESSRGGSILQAPPAHAPLGQPISVAHEETHHYVAEVERIPAPANDPAGKPAFKPTIGDVNDGLRLRLSSSRLMSGGILAEVLIEDTRLVGFHTEVVAADPAEAPRAEPSAARSSYMPPLNRLFRTAAASRPSAALHATIQVPEVVSTRAEGEWLIPTGGALVVSLGPCSAARRSGRDSYEERLVVLGYGFAGDERRAADPAVQEASATIRKAPPSRR
jgi:hypothetical protein